MQNEIKKRHSWDGDTCRNCGVQKRTRTVYTQDMKLSKKVYDYLINNEWVMQSPNCKK